MQTTINFQGNQYLVSPVTADESVLDANFGINLLGNVILGDNFQAAVRTQVERLIKVQNLMVTRDVEIFNDPEAAIYHYFIGLVGLGLATITPL